MKLIKSLSQRPVCPLSRRTFLRSLAAGACALTLSKNLTSDEEAKLNPLMEAKSVSRRPNILYIMTDQQNGNMLSCTGNSYLKTPALDALAASGIRFERAYCSNPVCVPSRISMMTGHMPSKFGVNDNNSGHDAVISDDILKQCMGWIFKNAGYETVYGGKTHWASNMTTDTIGFGQILTKDMRDQLADKCIEFLERKHEKPFLLVASFINPHDISSMGYEGTIPPIPGVKFRVAKKADDAGDVDSFEIETLKKALELPEGISREEFFKTVCPPLPSNLGIPEGEPESVSKYKNEKGYLNYMREKGTEEEWRIYRWAYHRLTEFVDAEIGRILDALRKQGLEENTVVIFSSDHGEMAGSHRKAKKSMFYEESARVPFIISQKGVTPPGRVNKTHFIASGIDLIPTMCDFAGIEPPAGLPGCSIRPLAMDEKGSKVPEWRKEIYQESALGRMVRDEKHKFCIFEDGQQLMDMDKDPGEMKNFVKDSAYDPALNGYKKNLMEWMGKIKDTKGLALLQKA